MFEVVNGECAPHNSSAMGHISRLDDRSEDHRTVYYAMGGAFRVIGGGDAGLYFRHTDHLGSTSVLSDSDGYKVEGSEVVYAPFGEIREGEQSNLTDFGFTGQRLDDSTGGLMFYHARYYLPGLKRFISADTTVPNPLDPQAFNRYSYTLNNPLNFIDPTGHQGIMSESGIDEYIRDSGISDEWWPVDQSVPSGPVWDYLPNDSDPCPHCSNDPADDSDGNQIPTSTVSEQAWDGDLAAIVDLVVPTHGGWAVQGEVSPGINWLTRFGPISPAASGRISFLWNRVSQEWTVNSDIAIIILGARTQHPGGQVTTGPVVGWFQSSNEAHTNDDGIVPIGEDWFIAGNISGAVIFAATADATVPLEVDHGEVEIRIDPEYGTAPVTLYGGVGFGGPVEAGGGIGVGKEWFNHTERNLFDLFG